MNGNILRAGPVGLAAASVLLAIYFGFLTLVSGWEFTLEQFGLYWPYIVALAAGFGGQTRLFVYLRRLVDPSSGHHRKGVLRFVPIVPAPEMVELRIYRSGESGPRSFKWQLK